MAENLTERKHFLTNILYKEFCKYPICFTCGLNFSEKDIESFPYYIKRHPNDPETAHHKECLLNSEYSIENSSYFGTTILNPIKFEEFVEKNMKELSSEQKLYFIKNWQYIKYYTQELISTNPLLNVHEYIEYTKYDDSDNYLMDPLLMNNNEIFETQSERILSNNEIKYTKSQETIKEKPIFVNQFNNHTKNIFQNFDWNNVIVAGGLVAKIIQNWRNLYDIPEDSDIDLYIYGTQREIHQTLIRVLTHFEKYQAFFFIKNSLINIFIKDCPPIQIILQKVEDPSYIISQFDYSHVQILYNGTDILSTVEFLATSKYQITLLSIRVFKPSRLIKAKSYNYKLLTNKYNWSEELFSIVQINQYSENLNNYITSNSDYIDIVNTISKELEVDVSLITQKADKIVNKIGELNFSTFKKYINVQDNKCLTLLSNLKKENILIEKFKQLTISYSNEIDKYIYSCSLNEIKNLRIRFPVYDLKLGTILNYQHNNYEFILENGNKELDKLKKILTEKIRDLNLGNKVIMNLNSVNINEKREKINSRENKIDLQKNPPNYGMYIEKCNLTVRNIMININKKNSIVFCKTNLDLTNIYI